VRISWIPIEEEIMSRTREWPVRVMYMLIAAALALSLIIVAAPAQKVSANPGLSEWDMVSTPTVEDWLLAPESIIVDFTVGAGGDVAYSIVYSTYTECPPCVGCNPGEPEGPWYLLKSTDGAATWKSITKGVKTVIDKKFGQNITALLQVACDADDPDYVAVALLANDGLNYLAISKDGGSTFKDALEVRAGATVLDSVIDLEVSPAVDDVHTIAISGTLNNAGKVFRLGDYGWDDTSTWDGWESCEIVADIRFSPNWDVDNTLLAVTADDNNVYLQTGNLEAETWSTVLVFTGDVADLLRGATAGVTLPLDYKGTDKNKRYAWVWVNYFDGGPVGTIFQVVDTDVTAVNMQITGEPWLTNVSYLGYIAEGKAIAGLLGDGEGGLTDCCEGVQVYRIDGIVNMDLCPSCVQWAEACKPPTGRFAMAAFYVSADKAYAVALGPMDQRPYAYDEGAWSVSFDDGDIWNQLSLIDTNIDYLSDVAVSPNCNKMMLVSVNLGGEGNCGCDSVWLYGDDIPEEGYSEYSDHWMRTWNGQLTTFVDDGEPEWGLLRLAPEEVNGDTVYLVDYGTTTVYWNTVETLGCWESCTASKLVDIVDLAVSDNSTSTIYALASDGMVAMSDEYACNWHTPVDSLICGYTIAVNGDYVLVGDFNGKVSYSSDGGETFTLLEDVADNGYVTVAFDSYFDDNDTIYAAVGYADGDNGIYRWVIGTSTEWQDIGAEPYDYTGLVVSNADGNPFTTAETGGVLYASYVNGEEGYDDGAYTYSGVARCLTPAGDISCEKCVEWDYLIVGLNIHQGFEATPDALKICGCLTPDSNAKLYAIDDWHHDGYDMCKGEDGTVWTFEDCYAKKAPSLISPADGFTVPAGCAYCANLPFTLKWAAVCDACDYDIQIALDEDFTEIVDDLDYTVTGLSAVVGDWLTSEVTYYWRVRAHEAGTGQVIHSWWSDVQSVTVAPAGGAGVNVITPEAGAIDVARTKLAFTWSSVASADSYEFVLSKNADLSSPVETKSGLTTTAYTSTKTLDYDTPYYWQVTAYKGDAAVSASTVGTFRTVAETVPVEPITAPTPFWVWVVIAIGAVLVIVVIVLIFRTRRV
jgi:hypothetical protein